ncbi:MAG: hypothetical protein DHS20C05_23300 [Hyphococcus sp.]|nr:MAG: hypothetical protein DHS20C05_23300 [Marinicaulis sp.]
MTRQQGMRPINFARPSRKSLLVASLAGVVMAITAIHDFYVY